ncbi:glycosyltransferase [Scytonema sp. UIC 10036]|uniref:glycosyltransferase family 2 protein n=1 Tax=Scytonema sp. UIC 10036 TaxID=2304196 RepID=UPI0012DA7D92|nr:glycosyltransferase [Scytonema sp. UIC 10036]MUG93847.1 glycosyltransferase [Scytonema sp. UIC 10036]
MEQTQLLFSIIIPTYNRPEQLTNCLNSLTRLDYPRDRFEVIVVDDGSTTPLESVVAPFYKELNFTLLKQTNAGPASARNTGSARAQGKFLVFTDDDCVPAPDWLTTLATRFTTAPDIMVGGKTLNALPNNLYSTASQLLIDYLYTYYNTDSGQPKFFTSNNLALPTDHFHALGGFDTTFPLAAGEDREFCDRWLYQGYKMIYAPEVQVHHAHNLTLPKFWRQHFNYGRGAFCFHTRRSQRTDKRIKVEPLPFYLNLLTYSLSHNSKQLRILVTVLFLLSQVANVAGFFWERFSSSPPY